MLLIKVLYSWKNIPTVLITICNLSFSLLLQTLPKFSIFSFLSNKLKQRVFVTNDKDFIDSLRELAIFVDFRPIEE